MQNLSHDIEQYILNRIEEDAANFVSLRRKDLAEKFECVPSQINYVLRSRFSPEQGYIIESRRGEHGYIKIIRITCVTPEERVKHIEDVISDSMTLNEARRYLEYLEARDFITPRERLLMEISLRSLNHNWQDVRLSKREKMFARLLKSMLKGLMLITDEHREED